MVDLVVLQREDLGQPAADFVEHGHGHERLPAVEPGQLGGGDGDGIKIVVAELAARRAAGRVVAEVRAVGVPLAHGRRAGQHGLLGLHAHGRAEQRHAACRHAILERLAPQHGRRIGAAGQRRHAAGDAVEMKLLDPGEHRVARARMPAGEHVERILADSAGLVRVGP